MSGQTTVQWQAAVSGNWFTAGNWNPAVVPDFASPNSYRAVVGVTGTPYVITADGGTNIDLAGFDVSSANARVFFDFTPANIGLTLASGSSTWSAGVVEFGNARLVGAGNTATTINLGSAAQLLFTTNTGTRTISSLALNNSGLIRASTGVVSLSSVLLNNQPAAVIHADGAEIRFQSGVTLSNSGILRATGPNGILRFQSPMTTAALGTIELVGGGRALLQTTINNTAANLAAPIIPGNPNTSGSYEFLGATITGGTIAAGALTFTNSNGTLSGATLTGDLVLPGSTYVTLTGGTTFTGANLTLGNAAYVYWQQTGTLAGKTLTFGPGSLLYLNGTNAALILASGSTAAGDIQIYSDGSSGTAFTNEGAITHTGGNGQIYARPFTNSNVVTATGGTLTIGSNSATYPTLNTGTITSTGAGTLVTLNGPVDNNGTILAQNSGIVRFSGSNTTANLGTVNLSSGGRAQINGTIDNTAATLAGPTILGNPNVPGSYEFLGGTITGGAVAADALTFTNSNGTLSGVTLQGDLVLPNSTYVTLTNGSTFAGANLTLGGAAYVYWQQAGSLAGKALTFGPGSLLYLNGTNAALTLAAGSTATGEIQIYSDGNTGTAFTNAGTITHTGGSGQIYARSFTNSNMVSATAGTLAIGSNSTTYPTINDGTIVSTGSGTFVTLNGPVDNNGTVLAQNSGIVRFSGSNTTANLGTVNLSNGGRAQLNGTLDNTATTLTGPTILGNPNTPGSYEFLGGTITGGTVATGALTFTSSNGTLSGAILAGDLVLPNSTYVSLSNGGGFAGANLTLGSAAYVYWQQAGSLAGKALTFGSGSLLYLNGTNAALTLAAGSTATGDIQIYSDGNAGTAFTNAGTITHTGGSGQIYARPFTNSGALSATGGTLAIGSNSATYPTLNTGTITSTGAGTLVTLNGPVDNNGTVLAQNSGIVRFSGSNTTANLGTVNLSNGGRAQLNGALDNTATTLTGPTILGNPNTLGSYEFLGGTITGGTVAAGALTFTGSNGTLAGATLAGDLVLPDSTYVTLTNGGTFAGANLSLGSSAYVYWQQAGSLAGKTLTFGSGSLLYLNGTNAALTLATGSTATGDIQIYSDGNTGTAFTNAGAITHSGGSGQIYARSFTNSGALTATGGTLTIGVNSATYPTTNTGTITASGSGTMVTLQSGVDNNGTIIAQNQGIVRFSGSNTTANLGAIQLINNGRVQLNGALDNTSETLAALTAGVYELLGGTINGGTVAQGALAFTGSNGTLAGVSLQDNLTLPASTYVTLAGNTSVSGTNLTLGNSAYIYWQQSGTLSGKSLSFGSGALIFLSGGVNHPLTLASNSTATGSISIYTDGSIGNSFTNQGTLNHTGGGGQIFAHQVFNTGTINATAGSLSLGVSTTGYSFANSVGGTINVAGATVSVNAAAGESFLNQGLIHVQSGTLLTNGKLLNDDPGTIRGAGTINGGLTMAGGTLEPGNSIGTLTLTGGAFSITDATVFAFEVGGSTADRLLFVNPAAPVNLGAGLVTLSLTLLSAPTLHATYNFLQISSGGSGITGTFANLPVNGSTLTADFGGISYPFTITYQANLISLQAIPEPGTYALLGAGLAAIFLLSCRRRR